MEDFFSYIYGYFIINLGMMVLEGVGFDVIFFSGYGVGEEQFLEFEFRWFRGSGLNFVF